MKAISISLAGVSISFASLCLVLLAISIPDVNGPLVAIPKLFRLIISLTGTALIVGSSFLIDWMIDSFTDEDWKELNRVALQIGEKEFNNKFEYFLSRCKLFGGGYLLVCIGVSILTYAMIWLFNIHADFGNEIFKNLSNFTAFVTGLLIFFKMMTRRSGPVMLIIVAISSISIFGQSLSNL